jgi:hypothetical protein
VTVVSDSGEPVGMVTPKGDYDTVAKTKVGSRGYDADEGREFEVVWDGASKKSLLGVSNQ